MRSPDIRRRFLDFFSARDHRVVPSGPLVPSDPTLLLTGAGMDQFKPYFLGQSVPAHPRAVSVQKCARTSDIHNVGRTTRHSTFFEMLGNFSFGDYFKSEAAAWAWELLTEGFGLDPARLWATVHQDDGEAERLWRRLGVPASRIQRLGMADNYWSMGVPGPCGPSSELHYDRGPAFGREGGPAVNGERYLELWNLVFMQNVRGEGRPRRATRSSASCRPAASTPAWAWTGSRRSCRTWTPSARPTCWPRRSASSRRWRDASTPAGTAARRPPRSG